MDHARGVQLHQRWSSMDGVQKIKCIKAIMTNVKHITNIVFPAYGSIYFAQGPVDSASKLPLHQGFALGPNCRTRYWDCEVGERRYFSSSEPNQGPWPNLKAYCDGLIDNGLSRLPAVNEPRPDRSMMQLVASHIRLLGYGREVIQALAADHRIQTVAEATLQHPDLHMRNIFVSEEDPTIVTDMIDWQSTSIEPAFEYADEAPDFTVLSTDSGTEDKRNQLSAELCLQAYDACLMGMIPKLAGARAIDDDHLRPFRYCHRTWKDGAVVFKQELIDISRRWEEFNLPPPCPYPLPSPKELLSHQKDFEIFEKSHKLKQQIMDFLDVPSDGWVPAQRWAAIKKAHEDVYEGCVTAVRNKDDDDDEVDEEMLRKMWPFDLQGL
ncbi:MAG: hypothetical protein Q9218_003235 [Villophora microphyllina]